MTDRSIKLSEILGQSFRRLRLESGTTLEDASRLMRKWGLPWSSGTVGSFEGSWGPTGVNFGTTILIAAGLSEMAGRPITLVELFSGTDSPIEVRPGFTMTPESLVTVLRGEAVQMAPYDRQLPMPPTSPERRSAAALGIPVSTLQSMALAKWGCSFDQERDRRMPPEASAQHRGQESRRMVAELRGDLSLGGGV